MKPYYLLFALIILSSCQSFDKKDNGSFSPANLQPSAGTVTIATIRSTTNEKPTEEIKSTPTIKSFPTQTKTPIPSQTPILIVPFLEGTVKEQSSCRYGAGVAYLFEWGLYPGDHVRIINRNGDGNWVYVKPSTYNNECWMKAELLDFKGDIYNLEEFYSPLPYVYTYLYKPVKYVMVERNGEDVIINWDPVWMTEDDDRGYLIEAWVCQDGKFIFLATNYFPYTKTNAIIHDESGCTQESNARFYTVEKHGYMPFIEIPWPHYQ